MFEKSQETLSKKILLIFSFMFISTILCQAFGPVRLYINQSNSLKKGLYLGVYGHHKSPMVLVHPPAKALELGCAHKQAMLLKHVVQKRPVCLHSKKLYVAHTLYSTTAEHVPLGINGCVDIKADEVFLATTHPRSCDSRVFGPVPKTQIWGHAYALMTWR